MTGTEQTKVVERINLKEEYYRATGYTLIESTEGFLWRSPSGRTTKPHETKEDALSVLPDPLEIKHAMMLFSSLPSPSIEKVYADSKSYWSVTADKENWLDLIGYPVDVSTMALGALWKVLEYKTGVQYEILD